MIPKIIHYCWFGRKPLPQFAKNCICSWQKFLPEYEIKEWNEDNFDVNSIAYTRQAYEAKKYAFVSDYVRFWALYHIGGIYFDTDVEIIKPIDDILAKGAYIGCETDGSINDSEIMNNTTNYISGKTIACAPGLGLACEPGLEIFKEFLNGYLDKHFIKSNGEYDLTTVVAYTTNILFKYGLRNVCGLQKVEGINIYPSEYFCPINYYTGQTIFTENTRTIHHYAASWVSEEENYKRRLKMCFSKLMPMLFAERIAFCCAFIRFKGLGSFFSYIFQKKINFKLPLKKK